MFHASKLQDYVEEELLFQNITQSKNHTCWPRSPICSHSIKLWCLTFLLVLWCRNVKLYECEVNIELFSCGITDCGIFRLASGRTKLGMITSLKRIIKICLNFTVEFSKLLTTHPIHIVVWGNFPFYLLVSQFFRTKDNILFPFQTHSFFFFFFTFVHIL